MVVENSFKSGALGACSLFAGWIYVAKKSAATREMLNSKALSRSLPTGRAPINSGSRADGAPYRVPERSTLMDVVDILDLMRADT